jgi:hypothetical protein
MNRGTIQKRLKPMVKVSFFLTKNEFCPKIYPHKIFTTPYGLTLFLSTDYPSPPYPGGY